MRENASLYRIQLDFERPRFFAGIWTKFRINSEFRHRESSASLQVWRIGHAQRVLIVIRAITRKEGTFSVKRLRMADRNIDFRENNRDNWGQMWVCVSARIANRVKR